MPCLIAFLGLLVPRFAIVILVLAGDYIGRAYQTTLWPLLGFFFMPYTTLAYAFAINDRGSVSGWHLALVVLAVLADFGFLGNGEKQRRLRRQKPR